MEGRSYSRMEHTVFGVGGGSQDRKEHSFLLNCFYLKKITKKKYHPVLCDLRDSILTKSTFLSDGPAEAPVTNGSTTTVPPLNDDLDIFGPMISNPLPATVMPPAQVCSEMWFYMTTTSKLEIDVPEQSLTENLFFRPGLSKLFLQFHFV